MDAESRTGNEGSVSDRDADRFDATSEAGGAVGDFEAGRQRFESALEHAAIGMP
jgi:hypothetical protein